MIMIIVLARVLADHKGGFNTWKSLLPVAAWMLPPFLLVFIQPDLGTSLVFAAICFGMLYVSGLRMKLVRQALLALRRRSLSYGDSCFMIIRKRASWCSSIRTWILSVRAIM